ncbi:MAG: hypothetical protein ACLQVJ_13540, partial [Syntrophobacteraceae bacterium]
MTEQEKLLLRILRGTSDANILFDAMRSLLRKDTIGVGTTHWIASPLPPNRTGGSPASGSPVDGFTSSRTGTMIH